MNSMFRIVKTSVIYHKVELCFRRKQRYSGRHRLQPMLSIVYYFGLTTISINSIDKHSICP